MSVANGSISLFERVAQVDRLKRELRDLGKEHQRDFVQPLEEIVETGKGDG